ncbi:MAG: hypothetical protein ABJI39_14610, partial [Polaribacter sp.]
MKIFGGGFHLTLKSSNAYLKNKLRNFIFIESFFSKKNLILALFFLAPFLNINAQCDTYNYTLSSNKTNGYVFQSGVTRVTENVSISNGSGATFNDGAILCISSGKKLTISGITSNSGSIEIYIENGELYLQQNPSFNANINIKIGAQGKLTAQNSISFNGSNTTFYNEGIVSTGSSINFASQSINEFDNLGTMNIGGEINGSSSGTSSTTSKFRNQGIMNITNNFQISVNSTLTNCGTINSGNSFNHNGGKVTNTGVFNIPNGALAMGANTAKFYNYGTFTSSGDVNLNGEFYTEGFSDVGGKIQGNGNVTGPPTENNETGYIEIGSQSNISGNVGPNLDIKSNSSNPIQNANIDPSVTFNCEANGTCVNPKDTYEVCALIDGTIPCGLTDPGTLTGSCVNNFDLQFTLTLEGNSEIGASYTISGANETTGIYNTATTLTIPWGANGQDQTITVTDIDDPNCTLTITISGVLSCKDSDNDGIADSIDLDDDNDGIPDTLENGTNNANGDEDGDGIPNYLDTTDNGNSGDSSTTDYTDANNDGIPDVYDNDNDGIPNHLDLDSDNDGIADIVEAGGEDTDGNGLI